MNEKNKLLSVVIPTMGRVEVFEECLQSLLKQTVDAGLYEVIVVDDGKGEASAENIVKKIADKSAISIKYLRGEHKGVGPARNMGVLNADAVLVLIIGNDIIASENFLREHLKFHEKYSSEYFAVLGQSKLHREAMKSPFMKVWGDLPYREIENKIEVPCWYFFTGNISFKKDFFITHGMFDERFKRIGCEDVEVGFRLHKKGLKIMYNKDAVGFHNHPYTFREACGQQVNHGYNFGILIEKLEALGMEEYIPMLCEKYGLVVKNATLKGHIKSFIKKHILHKKIVVSFLEGMLDKRENPGRISAFMYPKVFTYYTNKGFRIYQDEKLAGKND